MWQILGFCMMEAFSAVCFQCAPNLWTASEQTLWSDYIRTSFDIGAQRCQLKDKGGLALTPETGIL